MGRQYVRRGPKLYRARFKGSQWRPMPQEVKEAIKFRHFNGVDNPKTKYQRWKKKQALPKTYNIHKGDLVELVDGIPYTRLYNCMKWYTKKKGLPSGKDENRHLFQGRVLKVFKNRGTVLVDGFNLKVRPHIDTPSELNIKLFYAEHGKPVRYSNLEYMPHEVHYSNINLVDPRTNKPCKIKNVKLKHYAPLKSVRVNKATNKPLPVDIPPKNKGRWQRLRRMRNNTVVHETKPHAASKQTRSQFKERNEIVRHFASQLE